MDNINNTKRQATEIDSDSIELEFECSRPQFAQNAQLICEAIPDDAQITLFTCADCGKPHLHITLPPRYTGKFADRLESDVRAIMTGVKF